ncbi:MAG: phage Gp37/Gp68 family protein, partial [Alistipes sp.]|nr:phage Gp37/Gp68 family protein [Alistipes sp.]
VENQEMAERRLPCFLEAPIRHRVIICAPLLGPLDLRPWLTPAVEEVSVGGESGSEARVCDYGWVTALRRQCVAAEIPFRYHQTGARLLKEGRLYRIRRACQHEQARRAGIDYKITDRE